MLIKSAKLTLVLLVLSQAVLGLDFYNSEIEVVTDATRYRTLNPDVDLTQFEKVYVKGSFLFKAGEHITGDSLILRFTDEAQFTKASEVEVLLRYPEKGTNGNTITAIEIYVTASSEDADAWFTEGGINKSYAEILLECNKTVNFSYEIYIYGY
ncbi:uncharacterized protein LOC119672227 [Teleopsis dalmanni]|uniref:uncharacterized protein LOC119672227 n=1 Tax=Teleopsis dalmanni TaxID=139649 RepID=UPI0018CF18ED|nr:uncharacterized protein LOC119672227 [Teleopsis dalmanni]